MTFSQTTFISNSKSKANFDLIGLMKPKKWLSWTSVPITLIRLQPGGKNAPKGT